MSELPDDTILIDINSPVAHDILDLSNQLFSACYAVAENLTQPGQTTSDHRKQALSYGLQAMISASFRFGADDQDVFVALAVAVAWVLGRQRLTSDHHNYLGALVTSAIAAEEMGKMARRGGFKTAGNA